MISTNRNKFGQKLHQASDGISHAIDFLVIGFEGFVLLFISFCDAFDERVLSCLLDVYLVGKRN